MFYLPCLTKHLVTRPQHIALLPHRLVQCADAVNSAVSAVVHVQIFAMPWRYTQAWIYIYNLKNLAATLYTARSKDLFHCHVVHHSNPAGTAKRRPKYGRKQDESASSQQIFSRSTSIWFSAPVGGKTGSAMRRR
jgi:hypothetical protein